MGGETQETGRNMNFKKLLVCAGLIGVSAFGVGCGDDDVGTTPPADMGGGGPCSEAMLASGDTHFYVVSGLELALRESDDPPASAGFNIDGDAVVACNDLTAGVDAEVAGVAPDNGTGIDNALGETLGGFVSEGTLRGSINDGSVLLLIEVRGVDSFMSDSCVGVTAYLGALPAGTTAPMLEAMRLAPGQTFDLSPESFIDGAAGMMPRIKFGSAQIVGGRLQAGPTNFPLALSLSGVSLAVTINDAQLRFNISATAMTGGVLGGSLNTDQVIAAYNMLPDPPLPADSVADILSGLSDIDENGSPDSCEAGSIAIKLQGVTAVRGVVAAPPVPMDGGVRPDAGVRDGGTPSDGGVRTDGGARDGA